MIVFQILGILFLGMALFFLIGGLRVPTDFALARKIIIRRPKEEVFEYLRFLEHQNQWSVWNQMDPKMEKRIEGEDGSVGASYHWSGNKKVGQGMQRIEEILPTDEIRFRLEFIKPWKSKSNAYFLLQSTTDVSCTEVTWGFKTQMPYPSNAMMLVFNMDKAIGKDYETGLQNLKNVLEQ